MRRPDLHRAIAPGQKADGTAAPVAGIATDIDRPRDTVAARERNAALDVVRGAAALAIVALHAWLYTTTVAQKNDSLLDGIAHQLRLGVPLFFVLSGYLLYGAWVRAHRDGAPPPALRDYARKRAWRIVPGYAACLVGSLALLTALGPCVRGVDLPQPEHLWLFAVFASNLKRDTLGALDPPMWTLAVEVQFYVVLPLAAALVPRWRRSRAGLLVPPAVVLVAGTLFNLVAAHRTHSQIAADSLPAMAPVFACGMLAATVDPRVLTRGRAALLLLAGVLLAVGDGWWHQSGDTGVAIRVLRDLPAGAGFAAIVLVLAHRGHRVRSRPLAYLGGLSYGIYLWHMPLMLGLRGAHLFPEGRPFAAFFAVLAATVPVAWLSWTLVERPLLQRSRRAPRRGRRGRPAPVSTPATDAAALTQPALAR